MYSVWFTCMDGSDAYVTRYDDDNLPAFFTDVATACALAQQLTHQLVGWGRDFHVRKILRMVPVPDPAPDTPRFYCESERIDAVPDQVS